MGPLVGLAMFCATTAPAEGIRCEIRPYTGRPTVFVDGVPRFPMAFMSYYPQQYRYREMSQHGIHVYSLSLTLTEKWLGGAQRVKWNRPALWTGPDTIDFATVDKSLQEILDVDPQALIFPRIFCDSPAWWDSLHPDDGIGPMGTPLRRQSFSSLAWRQDTAAALRKIVRHVSASKYGQHVIGYMLTAGGTEELGRGCESSPCAQRRFRQWLAEKHGPDGHAIEQRFGKPLDAITIPARDELITPVCGDFLDPQRSRLVIEYRQFHPQEVVDGALALCRAVKQESQGRLMTGIFYGYTRWFHDQGHLALRRVLTSKDVDFITTTGASGSQTGHLAVGKGAFLPGTEVDSVLKAGKLFYYEVDARTSLSRWISQTRPDIDPEGFYNEQRWLGPPTLADSLQLYKAIFARVLVSGWAHWWFDLWGGWYDDPAFLRMFAQMQQVGDRALHRSRKSVAQIAVLLDENAYRYRPYGPGRDWRIPWIEGQLYELNRIGAPYDFYLLDDLQTLDLTRYRMIVFLNAFALSDQQRQLIRTRCMTGGRQLVWLYAPGVINETLSAGNISSLLGMDVRMEAARGKTPISVQGIDGVQRYDASAVKPFFYVAGGADAVVGRTSDGRTVVAEKNGPRGRQVFVAAPPLPWRALRHYAQQANVHLYTNGDDVVFASESYLAVAAPVSGRRTLRLPQPAALHEVLALPKGGTTLGQNQVFPKSTTFELDLADHTCRVFEIER
jgi:beta-galactosidase